ncbi:hypothetical protein OTU49_016555, partial [Cherax quadricarinatus]
ASAAAYQDPPSLLYKRKWYDAPPQTDPSLEKKRKQAVKAFLQRQKKEQFEQQLQLQLVTLPDQISALQSDIHKRRQVIAELEAHLQLLKEHGMNSGPYYG